MNELTIILAAVLSATALGVTGLAVLLLRNRKLTESLDFCLSEVALLEEQLEGVRTEVRELETGLSLIETRQLVSKRLQPKRRAKSSGHPIASIVRRPKTSLHDQRTRVLRLAKNGSDAKTIAATLGMIPGEVDLILRLNSFAANAANAA